jgi:hypothetical protein
LLCASSSDLGSDRGLFALHRPPFERFGALALLVVAGAITSSAGRGDLRLELAHAHARSGDAVAIAAYLGSGDAFDRTGTHPVEPGRRTRLVCTKVIFTAAKHFA